MLEIRNNKKYKEIRNINTDSDYKIELHKWHMFPVLTKLWTPTIEER